MDNLINLNNSFSLEDWNEFEEKIDSLHNILNNENVLFPDSELNKKTKSVNRSYFNTLPSAKNEETLATISSTSSSPNVFMKMVEDDANRRFKERTERNYEATKLKNAGNLEFRNGNLEKALCSFNKALDLRHDSYVLYINRALTYLQLGLFTKCIQDCDAALKLKDTLKGRLLKVKAYFKKGNKEIYVSLLQETREKFKNDASIINDYIADWNI